MENNNLIHTMDSKEVEGMTYITFFTLIAVAVIIGAVLSFGFSRFNKKTTNNSNTKTTAQSAGVVDKKTFKDSVEGILREGGIDGEGNFHLERPGGVSQNVYLTSTTVDLSNYIGKKVKVWGQTFQAEKAGWLMDVGSVEMQK
ncbi:MAG: hypothetical protein US86_C0020G0004 [Candidatus Daviesbacteria bacterium GW2011_GWA2_38_24]|uniref:Uncharacterized protein n=1 Tax=Candidatus Daviesbacteria bacterium GW2011_GWA2_38_24 TaxID=1618422 RepID=A0A0G0MHZ3_9BACT|nr:MAG: hypothetical protein US86_C0020G0004 [Candidatus Daviesbacteria bacterium GW2011_GWA2_38_24]